MDRDRLRRAAAVRVGPGGRTQRARGRTQADGRARAAQGPARCRQRRRASQARYGRLRQFALCGGADNDTLRGGYDTQLIFGGAGHDLLAGDRQNDELRGGAGQGVLQHPSQEGTDLLLGEGDSDCMYVNGPTQAGSTCSAEWGVANYYDTDGQSISWCDWETTNCCSVSPAC